MAPNRLVILVNGLPGAGKTTLSRQLAEVLGIPLFCKDMIKETWADILGSEPPDGRPQREWNALFGAAASQTLWNLLAVSPVGGLVDSPLAPRMRHHVEAGLSGAGVTRPLEVWCDAPAAVALSRRRGLWPERHPIHGLMSGANASDSPIASASDLSCAGDSTEAGASDLVQARPLGLGPVLRVDTTRTVDVGGVAAWCQSQ
ncbi:MAG TPA: hypothetical protein VE287_03255 [Actinopolymorphaceae bacterium]|nr:hypothetical protein [Actinopolymorphaceae bacterium]